MVGANRCSRCSCLISLHWQYWNREEIASACSLAGLFVNFHMQLACLVRAFTCENLKAVGVVVLRGPGL